ncbi:hypothetical protein Zmor_002202 [Zophobas morio]|uniref:Uncharacterized protein n=1 Tax=Zophobas morio TaxID=2755281 RepID=A0AA38MTK6_9CUCU|nr:hypothetical protein Zmor_002202 [Zophobas morio]
MLGSFDSSRSKCFSKFYQMAFTPLPTYTINGTETHKAPNLHTLRPSAVSPIRFYISAIDRDVGGTSNDNYYHQTVVKLEENARPAQGGR